MKYFKVVGFDKIQHYKDRNPPWIKLYTEMLTSYEFGKLADASKWHLIASMLLASRYQNKIPADEKWLSVQSQSSTKFSLQDLESLGFIITYDDASNMLADCYQDASKVLDQSRDRVETETETEGEKRESREEVDCVKIQKKSKSSSVHTFVLTEDLRDYAIQAGVESPTEELGAFLDHHRARGTVFKDWGAAWRNWVRNSIKFKQKPRKVNYERPKSTIDTSLDAIRDFFGEGSPPSRDTENGSAGFLLPLSKL